MSLAFKKRTYNQRPIIYYIIILPKNNDNRQQTQAFQKRRLALVSDTIFFSVLIFSILWFVSETPQTALSYLFGASLSIAYSYGLGKYVESLGKGGKGDVVVVQQPQQPTTGDFGQARFVLIIILLAALAKFRGQTGLQEIPTIAGFFTYQLASLNQGMKDLDDESNSSVG